MREKSSVGKTVVDEIAEYILASYPNNESGIVYCFSRKECEQVLALALLCKILSRSLIVSTNMVLHCARAHTSDGA